MKTNTYRERVARTTFASEENRRDRGRSFLLEIFDAIGQARSTGKLSIDFSQGSICGTPAFEESQRIKVE